MNVQRVRFIEGPWDGRIADIDIDQYQGRCLTIPVIAERRALRLENDNHPFAATMETFTYGYVKLDEFGWFGLPGHMPCPRIAQAVNAVPDPARNEFERAWGELDTWRHLARFVQNEGSREVPGTRKLEEEPKPELLSILLRATVWTYK